MEFLGKCIGLFYFVYIRLILGATATVIVEGPCPDVTAFKNLNVSAFAQGRWYHIARYANDWDKQGDCGYLEFTKNGDNVNFKIVDVFEKHITSVEGFIDIDEEGNKNGVVNFHSPAFKGPEESDILPIYILDVNYDEYTIGYECTYYANKNVRHEYAWIVTRQKTLDEYSKNIIYKFLETSYIIQEKNLIWNHATIEYCMTKP